MPFGECERDKLRVKYALNDLIGRAKQFEYWKSHKSQKV